MICQNCVLITSLFFCFFTLCREFWRNPECRNCLPFNSAFADALTVHQTTSFPVRWARFVIVAIVATLGPFSITSKSYAQTHTKGRRVTSLTPVLRPGDYVWHPKVSPAGPVVILVSLPDQLLYVYRNGIRIGRSTVSTGKPGKATPTGVFTVLQKKGPSRIEHL